MSWTYAIERDDSRAHVCREAHTGRCNVEGATWILRADDGQRVAELHLCSNHCAAMAASKGLLFPPSMPATPDNSRAGEIIRRGA